MEYFPPAMLFEGGKYSSLRLEFCFALNRTFQGRLPSFTGAGEMDAGIDGTEGLEGESTGAEPLTQDSFKEGKEEFSEALLDM